MTQKPQQRRGLGRGLGSLIPTAPRPESDGDGTTPGHHPAARPGQQQEHGVVPTTGQPSENAGEPTGAGPAGADWIGAPGADRAAGGDERRRPCRGRR